jgi:hypothetical protein
VEGFEIFIKLFDGQSKGDGANLMQGALWRHYCTDLFQTLDLVRFGAMKNIKDHLANEPNAASIHGRICRRALVYEQTTTSFPIQSCFHKAGFSANNQPRPFKLEVNEKTLRQNDEFKELSDCNISIEELGRCRQLHRFETLNAEFPEA